MRFCSHCGSEYDQGVERCETCPDGVLVGPEDYGGRAPRPRTRGLDTSTFVRAGTADDPLTAELLSRMLDDAGIPVFARDLRGGAVDPLTTAVLSDWWELLVPSEDQARAAELVSYEKRRLASTEEEAARAAEEEELETEPKGPEELRG
ncbi:MAG: DUF2007 domain-containing protein [Myxococcaceae bacterium]|nr:DUF2007 domain-containing protein [Myxococcaceae bacterium]MCI0672872.1 DUF2007 domain-containing protein [Myxococcaceae bacterium]